MRSTEDMPGRGRRRPRTPSARRRRRYLLIVGVIALVVLLTSLRGIAGFYTDYLWFQSVGQTAVWRGLLGARLILALIFIVLFFALAWVNLYVADKLAPPFRAAGPEDELLERYHEVVAGRMGKIRIVVAGLLALIAGAGAGGEWNSWLLFVNGGDFGIQDPQFGYDVGFYVFRLPFLSFIVDWLFASVLIVLIVTAVAHYLNGGIRVQSPAARVTPQVKAHLSLLLAALAGIRAVDYWFDRFELTTSTSGVVDGATYTDVNARLPALNLLILISVAAAILFIVNIFRRGWTLPVLAVALWGFIAVVASGIYPAYVQRFQVQPNESARESEFIERNIEHTRVAHGLDNVDERSFVPKDDPDDVNLANSAETIRNIRLWDPAAQVSGKTFEQLQRIRNYYSISDIDVGRYMIDGELTQVGLGLRTIDRGRVPGNSWEVEHLAFTHGFGAVLAPSNASEQNEPEFLLQDIPVRELAEGVSMAQPSVYFGEDLDGYIMVNSSREEINYEDEDGTVVTEYDGEDGVGAGSLTRRLAFALRFGDINPIISNFMTGDTRVIYHRDIVDRVETLAPFLHTDADPYPVLLDDRVLWVIDMYTTTNRYPYAQRANNDQLTPGSGLDHRFNYVRNSVKATVDAYNGTVNFYVMEQDDPIVDAWRSAFPGLFSDFSEMPEGLEAHLRYPEDIFRVQTHTWERYHLGDPNEFYQQGDAWRVARDPGTAGAEAATVVTDPASGEVTGEALQARIPPYYQLLQLPGEDGSEFVMMRPFAPFSEDDSRHQLTAFMAARMDPGNYGELVVYRMPSGNLPLGPVLAAANIQADGAVSERETLLGQPGGGSRVLFGNLLLLPVDDALLYVQPFYVEAEEREVPTLEFVIAAFGEDVVIEATLQEALVELFGEQDVETREDPDAIEADEPDEVVPDPDEPVEEPEPELGQEADRAFALLEDAAALFAEADDALADGDLGTYQELVDEARDMVDEALDLLTAGAAPEEQAPPGTDDEDDDEPQPV